MLYFELWTRSKIFILLKHAIFKSATQYEIPSMIFADLWLLPVPVPVALPTAERSVDKGTADQNFENVLCWNYFY